MIETKLKELVVGVLGRTIADLNLETAGGCEVIIDRCRFNKHGDFSSGLPLKLSALSGRPAMELAASLAQGIGKASDGINIELTKPGFLNFILTSFWLEEALSEIVRQGQQGYLMEDQLNGLAPQATPLFADVDGAGRCKYKNTSQSNVCFYIQYIHARCSASLRQAWQVNVCQEGLVPARFDQSQWQKLVDAWGSNPRSFAPAFVTEPGGFAVQKALVLRLDARNAACKKARGQMNIKPLLGYAIELAVDTERFLDTCRVYELNPEVTGARLGVVFASQQVLKEVLQRLELAAPERL